MANVLNSIVSNKSIYPNSGNNMPAYTIDTEGKVKPLEYKGKLLPSRIIGSPIEYVKDLKKDVVSIGKAAKGEANDHELGRINDLAMKLGSLGLASYLFVKNPLKLSKAMEFAGFGTFFAAMSLWPKIAIQAPLKARTGVDIHQKYIDTQGRKKMLYQDPQYVLTDLYTKEDLEKLGDKLKVSKDIPDRDNFTKQRAQKVALQGNTLWMMTAGFASPLMSALGCNVLEKPIGAAIENLDMLTSERALNSGNYQGFFGKIKQKFADRSFARFIEKNANRALDDSLIKQLRNRITANSSFDQLGDAVVEELKLLREKSSSVDLNFVKNALKGIVPENVFESMSPEAAEALNQSISEGSFDHIAKIVSGVVHTKPGNKQKKLRETIIKQLNNYQSENSPALSEVSKSVKKLYEGVAEFSKGENALNRFINSRVGNKSGSFVAKQYDRFGNSLMKSLGFNMKELRAIANGNINIFTERLEAVAKNPEQYDRAVRNLAQLTDKYEQVTGKQFIETVKSKSGEIYSGASENMRKNGFKIIAEKISSGAENEAGTMKNFVNSEAKRNGLGAKSSFYRVLQNFDIFNRAAQKTDTGMNLLKNQLEQAMINNGAGCDSATLQKLEEACKRILLTGNANTHTEKLAELSDIEYKAVMDVLFGEKSSGIKESLTRTLGNEKSNAFMKNFNEYLGEFKTKVANWQNGMTANLSRRVHSPIDNAGKISNGIERNNIIGQETKDLVQDMAKKMYNSKKWLHIFGGAMAVLTAVTLVAGLMIGRKGETEKQVEMESRKDG